MKEKTVIIPSVQHTGTHSPHSSEQTSQRFTSYYQKATLHCLLWKTVKKTTEKHSAVARLVRVSCARETLCVKCSRMAAHGFPERKPLANLVLPYCKTCCMAACWLQEFLASLPALHENIWESFQKATYQTNTAKPRDIKRMNVPHQCSFLAVLQTLAGQQVRTQLP